LKQRIDLRLPFQELARAELQKIMLRVMREDSDERPAPLPLHVEVRALGAYILGLEERCQEHKCAQASLCGRLHELQHQLFESQRLASQRAIASIDQRASLAAGLCLKLVHTLGPVGRC